jgi:hypothetical protein
MTAANQFRSEGFGTSAPWQDLANSALYDGYGHFSDLLDNPTWMRAFLRFWKFGLPTGKPVPHRQLGELRALLRRLIEKVAAVGSLSLGDISELNAWLKVPVFPQLVRKQAGFVLSLQPVQVSWDAIVARIAGSFGDTLVREPQDRLKVCANSGCRWIFIDRTKGNVRRWCSDATCGNRDRVRRLRAARKHAS